MLYRKNGYDATTAAEIAAEAGVTERTFFRHFPDKREALFNGEDATREALARSIAEVTDVTAPLEVLAEAFRALLPHLAVNRPFAQPRPSSSQQPRHCASETSPKWRPCKRQQWKP